MSSKEKSNVIDILLFVIFIVPMTMFGAYTGMKLWNWFIAGTFGIMKLNMLQALGVYIVFTYLCPRTDTKNENEEHSVIRGMVKSFVTTSVFLLFGYIVYSLM